MTAVDRRRFLTGSLLGLGAAGVGAGTGVALEEHGSPAMPSPAEQSRAVLARSLADRVPFDGPHQAGILGPAAAQATFVALDSIAPNRALLFEGLQALSTEARLLTQGDTVGEQEVDDPAPDSGTLGAVDAPDLGTVTIAFGASLFDGRYDLASQRPRQLTQMPSFPNDAIDPTRAGGDILVQITAGQRDTVVHTLRELMRAVAGKLVARWT
ncbi:MAG TPA: Dyp-type peroxidase domain-containing protein, partial [Solirubrobacteraceae bacterium]|nr:Dyp-type peroxidase domain-containing protein [Solirubrobacteraceae bacterium]